MMRNTILVAVFGLTVAASAENTPTCDSLDHDRNAEFHGTDINLDGQDLVLKTDGRELLHIDAQRKLFVDGRPVSVPADARPHLDAYVDGFRQLGVGAKDVGSQGGKLAAKAVSGLVDVLFTSATMADYERRMEREGHEMEQKAEMLCRSVVALQQTERELQLRIPAFPAFIAPVNPAL